MEAKILFPNGSTFILDTSKEGDKLESVFKPAYYAFTDVETTGFDSLRNGVLTLACYVTDRDYNILEEIYLEFRPDGSKDIVWSEGAEKVHGISWQRAMSFPPMDESCRALVERLSKYPPLIFVAHNAPYDWRMIKGALLKADLYHEHYHLFSTREDTVKMIKESGLVSSKSKSLGAVCKELGIEHDHHDARSDAKVLIEIHKRITQSNQGNDALFQPEEENE